MLEFQHKSVQIVSRKHSADELIYARAHTIGPYFVYLDKAAAVLLRRDLYKAPAYIIRLRIVIDIIC